MSKNNLFKSWLTEAQQMLVEALPDAKEVVNNARIEIVSTRSWISVRDRVARECGESAHKRMLADKNIKDPNVAGEFISGSKGWAIVLKKEFFDEKELFIESVIHELTHAYCYEKCKELGLHTEEYEEAVFSSREVGLGYGMWKEFCAQAISKVICGAKGVFHEGDLIEELDGYLSDVIDGCSGEGLIGMFFADLLFDGKISDDTDREELLQYLLQYDDEDTQMDFMELYHLILRSTNNILEGFEDDALWSMGDLIGGIKLRAQIQVAMKKYHELSLSKSSSGEITLAKA